MLTVFWSAARPAYFSPEMKSLMKEYQKECVWQTDAYENCQLTEDDFVFRKHYSSDPMPPVPSPGGSS